ncbi:hypothetical protein ACN6AT_20215 [Streptomyces sp. JL4002]|uniref:hypothetical protein n=1 Tax=Streptomyces TaxID=1883 RepID=UPI0033E554A2
MAIADDLKKTLTDPTPLYFAAGTADLAVQQARKVPELIEQLRAEAPARIEAVKNTDPKAVQDAVTAKVAEVFGAIDPKKIGETAQDLALRGVGVAAEYAVRAKETYDKVAVHGEQAVRAWRGEVSEEIVDIAVVVEPEPEPEVKAEAAAEQPPAPRKTSARKTAAKKAAVTADDAG